MGRVNMEYLGELGQAVLLGNHGTLCVAPDLAQVLRRSIVLEDGARAAFHAAQLGPLVPIPPAEVAWLFDAANGFPAHHAGGRGGG
jgi:ribulose-5-phosphate 4-epimerase/fuculose-1-phosphate aldolase